MNSDNIFMITLIGGVSGNIRVMTVYTKDSLFVFDQELNCILRGKK